LKNLPDVFNTTLFGNFPINFYFDAITNEKGKALTKTWQITMPLFVSGKKYRLKNADDYRMGCDPC